MHKHMTDRSLMIISLIGFEEFRKGNGSGELLSVRGQFICGARRASRELSSGPTELATLANNC